MSSASVSIPVYGGLSAMVSACDAELVGLWKWHLLNTIHDKLMYARGQVNGKKMLMHRLLYNHMVEVGRKPPIPAGFVIDHIDGDGLNNTEQNLQAISNPANGQKGRKHVWVNSTRPQSCFVGVKWDTVNLKGENTWVASYRRVHLGSHKDPRVAACYYDHAIFREGLGGKTNSPTPDPLHPLSSRAIQQLDKVKLRVKNHKVADNITKTYYGAYVVRAKGGVYVASLYSLEQAIVVRDIAQKQSIQAAKSAAAQFK